MSKKSDEFEKKITRIKHVLNQSEAKIKWNDKMPDPDNLEQPRQIDISITKGKTVTHVECRIHKEPQSVKWIEELIGRKISLGVDSMIGVSASGFTKGAIKKAIAKGIILRDFSQITESEVERWGENSGIEITWLVFDGVKLNFIRSNELDNKITEEELLEWISENQKVVYSIFENISNQYPKPENPTDVVARTIQSDFEISEEHNNLDFLKVNFEANLEYKRVKDTAICLFTYGDPKVKSVDKRTLLEENENNSVEIISSDNLIGVTLDLSKIIAPKHHIFRAVSWQPKKTGRTKIGVNVVSTFERKLEFESLTLSSSSE